MDFYFPYQNNTYPTHSLSLYFTNITDFSLQQWITNHCTQIHQSQNVHIEPIYMRVEQREERRTENIIIEPIQK